MLVRPAASGDLSSLVGLLRRSWLASFAANLPFGAVQAFACDDPARAYAEAMWSAFSVAELNGRVAGMCHVADDLVAAIHVDPAIKRQGIGTMLMDKAEAHILQRFDVARLEVLAFNSSARAFYEHRGWREARRFQTTECGAIVEAIEMAKAGCRAVRRSGSARSE